MCRAFAHTLRRKARDWATTLLLKSIHTFDDFSKKITAYFASSKHAKKTAISLIDDALVIEADIVDFDVKRVLVDNGSVANIMSLGVFLGLKISSSKIKPITTPLHGFGGATVIPGRTIELPVTLGTYPDSVVIMTSFLLVKVPMAYNAFMAPHF
ncbi:Uncharacterized protein Adt_45683 [Abeliophyllum distichum]|uniref:Uncharacterized protein n=1 Tax=Abeliophyllum distichum TaxID=126358 RepID=A0ABD1PFV5_9LAMI